MGGAIANSVIDGTTNVSFDVWDTAPFGSMVYDSVSTQPWSGDVVAATIDTPTTASFVVRVDSGNPLVVGCDVTMAVLEGVVWHGTWEIASVVTSPGDTCGAVGGVQGPWIIFRGEIVVDG